MRSDAGIVAPHFLQQSLARHRLLAGTIKVTQDRRFLFGQANLAALRAEQQLRTWPERIGPDGEYCVFARLMLPKLRADTREQHGEAKRLCDIVVRTGFEAENRIGIGIVARQHDDGRLEAILAQDTHRLASIDIW